MGSKMTIGWKLDRRQRDELLRQFPPRWPDVIADHVTLESGSDADLPDSVEAAIIGAVDDGNGVQAMVVELDGTSERPDGSRYHITWSIDRAKGRKPAESNDVIRKRGWAKLDHSVPVRLEPAEF